MSDWLSSFGDRQHPLWLLTPAIFLAAEAGGSWWFGWNVYRRKGTFVGLGCSILHSAARLLLLPLLLFAYRALANHSLFNLSPESPVTWVAAYLVYSFVSYWLHRWQHEWRWLWNLHAVHHQGNEYNVSLALRDSAFADVYESPTILLLALVGIPETVAASVLALGVAHALLLHTTRFGDWGFVGWLVAAPSHHRAHHGVNPQYRDRNFSMTLILWDRLFGTFVPEIEPPVYGVEPRFEDRDPVYAHLAPWLEWWQGRALPSTATEESVPGFALAEMALVFVSWQLTGPLLWLVATSGLLACLSPWLTRSRPSLTTASVSKPRSAA